MNRMLSVLILVTFSSLGFASNEKGEIDYDSFEGNYKLLKASGYNFSIDRSDKFENLNKACESLTVKSEIIEVGKGGANRPARVLKAESPLRHIFSFGFSGVITYGSSCSDCNSWGVDETISEETNTLISKYDLVSYSGERFGVYGKETFSLSSDKKILTYTEIRNAKKPYQKINYKCTFMRVEK